VDYYISLGVPPEELGDGDAVDRLVDPSGHGPAIWFQVVPERKSLKNRLHLDLKGVAGARWRCRCGAPGSRPRVATGGRRRDRGARQRRA
jgi:hypothetical protein